MRLAAIVAVSGSALFGQARVRVELPAGGAVFGQPFELTVERAWPRDHDAQPFDPSLLAPLEVKELGVDMDATDGLLVERRRFSAAVFEVGALSFAPYELRTREPGGREHADEFAIPPLAVRSSLLDPPGEVEWPGDVREPAAAVIWPWLIGGLAFVGVLALSWRSKPRPAAAEVPAEAGPTPAEIARDEIDALALPGSDSDELQAYYLALARIVRRFAMRQLAVRAFVHTSEELIAVVPVGTDPLRGCLFACDLVKFAADRPEPPQHADARSRALAFVDANAASADAVDAELEVAG